MEDCVYKSTTATHLFANIAAMTHPFPWRKHFFAQRWVAVVRGNNTIISDQVYD